MSYFLTPAKRVKVVLVNETVWQTQMLRPFVTRIAREEFSGTKPSNTRRTVTVRIAYTRGGSNSCSGYAYYNSSTCTVRVPHPRHGWAFPVLDFCHVVGHEFGHCKGLKHKDMGLHYGNSCARGSYTHSHYDWAKALPVPMVPVKVRPTTAEKRAVKLKAAEAAVIRWTRKRKLADTKLKLWARKVKALERVMAKEEAEPVAACAKPLDTSSPPVAS